MPPPPRMFGCAPCRVAPCEEVPERTLRAGGTAYGPYFVDRDNMQFIWGAKRLDGSGVIYPLQLPFEFFQSCVLPSAERVSHAHDIAHLTVTGAATLLPHNAQELRGGRGVGHQYGRLLSAAQARAHSVIRMTITLPDDNLRSATLRIGLGYYACPSKPAATVGSLHCRPHSTAIPFITPGSVIPSGCRPSRMASTMSGAKSVSRSLRQT